MNYYSHNIGDFRPGVNIARLPAVYALATVDMSFVKIGKTTSIKQRLINIQSGCPFELFLWLTVRTPKPDEVEKDAHKRFTHCRTRGEWFKPTSKDLDQMLAFFQATNLNVKEVARALL